MSIKEYGNAGKIISSLLDDEKTKEKKLEEINKYSLTPNYYGYIKIAEGCRNNCSYCAIPLIRGSLVSKDKDIPKRLGFKTTCNVIHYNPWLIMASNSGQLLTLYKNIRAKNSKVVELNNDINRLASVVTKLRIANLKAKQEEKKTAAQNAGGVENAK
jgi:DNA repair photolyase